MLDFRYNCLTTISPACYIHIWFPWPQRNNMLPFNAYGQNWFICKAQHIQTNLLTYHEWWVLSALSCLTVVGELPGDEFKILSPQCITFSLFSLMPTSPFFAWISLFGGCISWCASRRRGGEIKSDCDPPHWYLLSLLLAGAKAGNNF